jgi:WhiB family redox-sensing transcriptional regulator
MGRTGAMCRRGPGDLLSPERRPAIEAKQVCGQCPVKAECLAYALDSREAYGIWGGLDPDERRDLRRSLRTRAAADALSIRCRKPSQGAA